ncbi:MAG TPA: TPM domain-containing protein [Opitutaceae bacterium]|nr:TPM domain-containing protein [Opitutaceae bacterium]
MLACFAWAASAFAAEVIPRAPINHFNDYALAVRRETADQLNAELAQFERDTSNQILVAIYPRMQSASSVDDYAVRVAQAWRVGQRERKNGAVLFVFQESHDIYIATGYGLEGVLPDALCKQIIENEIAPRFRSGDFDGGLAAGVHAMMAATRGEYRGTGRTNATRAVTTGKGGLPGGGIGFFVLMIIFMLVTRSMARRRGTMYGRRGRRGIWLGGPPFGGGLGGGLSGGGRSSWGSSGGGGGGTFSGGGGSFGGGGAGGKW